MKTKPIRKSEIWVNAIVEVICTECQEAYADDNSRQPENLAGWRSVGADCYCPDCVKAYRAEQSKAAASQGRGG